jgi:hypothetical protein
MKNLASMNLNAETISFLILTNFNLSEENMKILFYHGTCHILQIPGTTVISLEP